MSPERKVVLIGMPMGLLMTGGGVLMAATASGGDAPMGATVGLMGAAFLMAVVYILLPRRPVTPRIVDGSIVIDGSPWPWRFLCVLTVGTTAAAVLATIALGDPSVLGDSSGRRSPVVLLGLWPVGAWLWFVTVRARTRQRVTVRGDVVTLHEGRRSTQVRATRRRVGVGSGDTARSQSVVVRGPAREGELVLASRSFATTPEHLVDALRAALPE